MTLRTGYRYISEEKEYSVYIKGDTDGDGSVSTTDYILIKRSMLGICVLQNEYFKAADTDGNGRLTSTDCILLKRHILGISDLYEEKLPPLYEATTDTISDSAITTETSTETTAASEITIASAPTGTESAETTSECTAAEPTETFAVKG